MSVNLQYEIYKDIIIEHGCGFIDPKDDRNKEFRDKLNEAIDSKGDSGLSIVEPLILFVVLQKYDIKNKNGRIYPKRILVREAERYQELIDNRQAVGEAEHPDDTIINSERVSHEIKKIWFEGQTLVGEIEIIMTPGFVKYGIASTLGDRIANLLRRGIRVGVSSRGVGSVIKEDGVLIVQDDFEIICWDIVITPSTPGSYMFTDKKLSKPYVESIEKKDTKLTIYEEKLKKFLID